MDDLRYSAMTQCDGEFFGYAGIFDLETAKDDYSTAKILFDGDGMFTGAELLKIG